MINVKTMKDDTEKTKNSLMKSIKLLHDLLDEQRLALLYLQFDVEATRRERDYWRKQVEGK